MKGSFSVACGKSRGNLAGKGRRRLGRTEGGRQFSGVYDREHQLRGGGLPVGSREGSMMRS